MIQSDYNFLKRHTNNPEESFSLNEADRSIVLSEDHNEVLGYFIGEPIKGYVFNNPLHAGKVFRISGFNNHIVFVNIESK